ncbi:hypothetical protein DFA_00468 [Cavenderia fasciculata]|uniref:Fibronectin type-III domain-containing protein n=1 Tax=Cavenderia fasciculata TaxID=261658 RepID=F4PS09_CACFS|nr:uncharacterized protein DFA_00468 [Cavenderia fasciculata]EGG20607.1 hypothetical protein DFA_00468 [Cavenderia fasciculata]|eukprot:XP_004358457.1 hypothetical protein DFA_00468 [Cavenderia fasciculata]
MKTDSVVSFCIYFINQQWLHEATHDQPSDQTKTQLAPLNLFLYDVQGYTTADWVVEVTLFSSTSTVVKSTTNNIYTGSYKYSYDQAGGQASVTHFTDTGCTANPTQTYADQLGNCVSYTINGNTLYKQFALATQPLLQFQGYISYEKHYNFNDCTDKNFAARTLISPNQATCLYAESFNRMINKLTMPTGEFMSLDYGRLSVCGTPTGTLGFNAGTCLGVPGAITSYGIAFPCVVPTLTMDLTLPAVLSTNRITIPGISTSWKAYLNYTMTSYTITYQIGGAGTVFPAHSNCTSTTGCTFILPSPAQSITINGSPNLYVPTGLTAPSFSKSYQLPPPPTVTSLSVTSRKSTSITFNYNVGDIGIDGAAADTTYIVKLNGTIDVTDPTCIVGPTCTISNLSPGSTQTISVQASTNGYTTQAYSSSVTLYQEITDIVIESATIKTKSVSINYHPISTDTAFPVALSILVNGQPKASCDSSSYTTNGCLVDQLTPNTTNIITITASANGYTFSKDFTYLTFPSLNNYSFNITRVGTTRIDVSFEYQGGVGPVVQEISIPGEGLCIPLAVAGTCYFNVQPDTTYTVSGKFVNDGTSFSLTPQTVTTYPLVSGLEVTFEQVSLESLKISWSSIGGIPLLTTYSIDVAGTNFSNPPSNQTLLYQYPNGYPYGQTLIITVNALNDGLMITKEVPFVAFQYPSISYQMFKFINTLNLTWNPMTGGNPNSPTTYTSWLQYQSSGPKIEKCSGQSIFYCQFNHLLAGLEYNHYLTVNNFLFSIDRRGDDYTSQETNISCTNNCNNQGECILGSCDCNQGWDGPQCDIELSNNTSTPLVYSLTPSTTSNTPPSVTVFVNNTVKYSIALLKVSEVDTTDNIIVKTLDFSTGSAGGWQLNGLTASYTNANGVSILITFAQTSAGESSVVSFTGKPYNVTGGSTLLNITVSGWTFDLASNYLDIELSVSHPSSICSDSSWSVSTNSTFVSENNLASSLLIGNDPSNNETTVLLQGKLVNSGVVDTIPSVITYTSSGSNNTPTTLLTIRTPSFTQSVTVQPAFHIITKNITIKQCPNPSTTTSTTSTTTTTTSTTTTTGDDGSLVSLAVHPIIPLNIAVFFTVICIILF